MTSKQWTIAVRSLAFPLILLTMTTASRAQFQGGRGVNPRDIQPTVQPVVVSTEPPPLETDLVLLTVSVTSPENRPRPSLTRERFQVFEDGVEQKITYFWEDSRPVSVGLLVDDSDYMTTNHKLDDLRETLPTFLKSRNAE